jgi:hypothetical protein
MAPANHLLQQIPESISISAMVELSLEPRAVKLAVGTSILSGLLALRRVVGRLHGWKQTCIFKYLSLYNIYIIIYI